MARMPHGTALIEVLIVLCLAGLLLYGGFTSVQRLIPKLDLQSGLWKITSGLNQARFRAIMSGGPVRVRFVPAGFVFERYDEGVGSWRIVRAVVLAGVAVRANNNPVFHPQGTVSNLASISVSNTRGTYRISIAISGRIKTVRVA